MMVNMPLNKETKPIFSLRNESYVEHGLVKSIKDAALAQYCFLTKITVQKYWGLTHLDITLSYKLLSCACLLNI